MVEMAKAHGLNIYEYLKFLLEYRPNKDMTDEQLAELADLTVKPYPGFVKFLTASQVT